MRKISSKNLYSESNLISKSNKHKSCNVIKRIGVLFLKGIAENFIANNFKTINISKNKIIHSGLFNGRNSFLKSPIKFAINDTTFFRKSILGILNLFFNSSTNSVSTPRRQRKTNLPQNLQK